MGLTRREFIAGAACGVAAGVRGQEGAYPNRPVTLVIGGAAGGGLDAEARIISDALVKQGGHPFNLELRPGAMGSIGATAAYRAKPDGYTLMLGPASPMVFNQLTHKTLTYHPANLTPVILVGE